MDLPEKSRKLGDIYRPPEGSAPAGSALTDESGRAEQKEASVHGLVVVVEGCVVVVVTAVVLVVTVVVIGTVVAA